MISGLYMLFLVLLYDGKCYNTDACSATFINLGETVNVDHSTNVGEVVYTLMNGDADRSIEMESSVHSTYGLNPSNDHEVIVTDCVFWIGSELLHFKISGDSDWCGSVNFVSSPAIPQFTNPTEIIKIGTIGFMEFVDVVQVTFANDQCADFNCPIVTCTNDASQNFVYASGAQVIGLTNLSIQYGVTYMIEITCRDTQHSSGTSTQNVTVVFHETIPPTTTTTTASTATSTEFFNTTPTTPTLSTATLTSTTTTSTISTATPTTPTITPTISMATPTTTTVTPITTTTTPTTTTTHSTTTISPSTTTTTPTSSMATHTTTTTTHLTTTTIPTTTVVNPSTTSISFTKTVPISTSTLATHTTISATSSSQRGSSKNALAAGIEVSVPEITKVVAIAAGAATGGVGLLGLIAFLLYRKFAGTRRISPRSGRKPDDRAG